jgi:hypothetical protein
MWSDVGTAAAAVSAEMGTTRLRRDEKEKFKNVHALVVVR